MFLYLYVILFIGGGSLSGGVGGGLSGGVISVQGVSVQGEVSVQGVSLSGGLSVQGGFCHGDPPYGYVRAVRILLECILVYIVIKF